MFVLTKLDPCVLLLMLLLENPHLSKFLQILLMSFLFLSVQLLPHLFGMLQPLHLLVLVVSDLLELHLFCRRQIVFDLLLRQNHLQKLLLIFLV